MFQNNKNQKGLTIVDMMVGLAMFGIISVAIMGFASKAFRTLGLESKGSDRSRELRAAMNAIASEVRMSSVVSPYLPGNNSALVNCTSLFSVTANTIKFLVVHDDEISALSGLQPYYVGYKYDSTTGSVLRGEIPATSISACTLPAGDPTAAPYAMTIASNISPVDSNNDGLSEPFFSYLGGQLTINGGIKVVSNDGSEINQEISTQVLVRAN